MSSLPPTQIPGKQPPKLPASDVREAAAVATLPADDADTPELSLSEQLKSSAAMSYYISAAVHILAYGAMALAFAYIASSMNEEPDLPPIRASLDEINREDERPQFEEVGEIDMGSRSGQTSEQKLNEFLQQANGDIASAVEESMPSLEADGVGGEADDEDFKFRVPKSGFAVTKGSFTAWTVPESPEPGERYRIIIQIKLPNDVKLYSLNDLRGKVVGTDDYTQNIPYDTTKRFAVSYTDENKKEVLIKSRNERVKVRNNKVQLVVIVPGAGRLVKDTINLKSRRLREDHELTLVFGSQKKSD